MKILLTGATGTLGEHVIPALLGRGHELVHLGRGRLPLEHDRLHWVIQDFQTPLDPGALSGNAVVLHLANLTKEDPTLDTRVACELFDAAARAGAAAFFYASSIRVYGHRLGDLDEECPPAPFPGDAYGAAKLATEDALRARAAGSPTRLRILRIGHVITPANAAKAPRRLGWAFTLLWGRAFPHFIGISDVVDALCFLVNTHRTLEFDVFNLTREEGPSRYLDHYRGRYPFAAGILALPRWLSFTLFQASPSARETRCARLQARNLTRQGWRPAGPSTPFTAAVSALSYKGPADSSPL